MTHLLESGLGSDLIATLLILSLSMLAAYSGAVLARRLEERKELTS